MNMNNKILRTNEAMSKAYHISVENACTGSTAYLSCKFSAPVVSHVKVNTKLIRRN
jgi:phosphohistidine swiveling domain-containing protein